MHELKDKTVVITGASSGIGAAAALLFAAEGANVVLGARREALLESLVLQVTRRKGAAISLAGDVGGGELFRTFGGACEIRIRGS